MFVRKNNFASKELCLGLPGKFPGELSGVAFNGLFKGICKSPFGNAALTSLRK